MKQEEVIEISFCLCRNSGVDRYGIQDLCDLTRTAAITVINTAFRRTPREFNLLSALFS